MAQQIQVLHLHKSKPGEKSTQQDTIQLLLKVLRHPVVKAIHLTRKKDFCSEEFAREVEIDLWLLDYLPEDNRPQGFKLIFQRKQEEFFFKDCQSLENFIRQSELKPHEESIPGEIAIVQDNKVDRLMEDTRPLIARALNRLAQRKRDRIPNPTARLILGFRNGSLYKRSVTESELDAIYMK